MALQCEFNSLLPADRNPEHGAAGGLEHVTDRHCRDGFVFHHHNS
jgi:hypothetical protein